MHSKRLVGVAAAAVIALVAAVMWPQQAYAQSVTFTRVFCDLDRDVFSIEFVLDAPSAGNYDFLLIIENNTRGGDYLGSGTFALPASPVQRSEVDTFFSIGIDTQPGDDVTFTVDVENIGRATIDCEGNQETVSYAPPPADPGTDTPPATGGGNGSVFGQPPANTDAVANPRGCTDDLIFIDDVTIPDGTVIAPGGDFTKVWEIQNVGTCNWLPSYDLVFVSGTPFGAATVDPLEISAPAGDVITFTINMTAPTTPGTYQSYWQMQNDSGQRFGGFVFVEIVVTEAGTPTDTGTPIDAGAVNNPSRTCEDDLAFVTDVSIPDGSIIQPGQTFTKTWRVQNTGTCDWLGDYTLTFVQGTNMAGAFSYALGAEIPPVATALLSVQLTAPEQPGTYVSYWQVRNENGSYFGGGLFVSITVPGTIEVSPFPPSGTPGDPFGTPVPPLNTDTNNGLYVKPYTGPGSLGLAWAGQPPCAVFLTGGHGPKIAIASDFSTCSFPDVTVACLNSLGDWTRLTVFDPVITAAEARFTVQQHGLCGFFER